MTQYNVTGMSCAACSSRVEKAVSKLEGVTSCSVNLLTGSMAVEGTAMAEEIINAVVAAGYGASQKGESKSAKPQETEDENAKNEKKLRYRLVWSAVFLVVLMYFSMGHMVWGFKLPSFYEGNHVAVGITQMLLAGIIMVINQKFFISGYKSLWRRSPNMDTLVALGATAAFVYSVYALFAMTYAQANGDAMLVMHYAEELYFESAGMILTLITVGKMLEARAKGKTTDALKGLMDLSPKTAVILKDGREVTVPADNVNKDDIFIVRPGDAVPVDGIVIDGNSAVNESALTGESVPSEKGVGDTVSAATINTSGYLKCRATRVGEDTTLSQIIKMVSDASATKAPIAKTADKVSGVFVPVVIGIALISAVIWFVLTKNVGFSLARGISVLVISCPCALGLATPVAVMVGSGVGAKNGILFKTATSLEETGRVGIVAFDKTGTITKGEPEITDIIPADGYKENELLEIVYSLEAKSEHPLAAAIVKAAKNRNIAKTETQDFKVLPGKGLVCKINEKTVCGGNLGYIQTCAETDVKYIKIAEELANEGKTPLFFAEDNKFIGIIAVADTLKDESPEAVAELKKMGIESVMLTGDNERTAKAVARAAGIDRVIAGVLPGEKEKEIRELKKSGKVAMVGDGINDAPALTRADVGIAIGAGTDIAIDAADVVLVKSRLSDVPAAIRLSRGVLRNIRENLFWAFIYNVIGIPLAAGVFVPMGMTLNPMFGAAAMSLSSFCVVSNALRLNLIKLNGCKKSKNIKNYNKFSEEKEMMEKTMKIEGMMCPHCEAAVKGALEALNDVKSAEVSHEKGKAIVLSEVEIDSAVLKKTIEDKGYKVIEII